MKKAAEEIGKQNLDFSTACRENDEIGALCNSFESMRKELKTAFQTVWEEEKKNDELFRAFAHDLRTPLTILKGNKGCRTMGAGVSKNRVRSSGNCAAETM